MELNDFNAQRKPLIHIFFLYVDKLMRTPNLSFKTIHPQNLNKFGYINRHPEPLHHFNEDSKSQNPGLVTYDNRDINRHPEPLHYFNENSKSQNPGMVTYDNRDPIAVQLSDKSSQARKYIHK